MNASAEHNHLFSPLEGEDTDHSSHISLLVRHLMKAM